MTGAWKDTVVRDLPHRMKMEMSFWIMPFPLRLRNDKSEEMPMLEIPESLTLAKQMNQRLRGRKIADAEAARTKHSQAIWAAQCISVLPVRNCK